jgi:hypothetical protein
MELRELQRENEMLKRQVSEIMRKKRSDSVWTKTKRELRPLIEKEFGSENVNKIEPAISAIARVSFERRVSANITEADGEGIKAIFEGIIEAIKTKTGR